MEILENYISNSFSSLPKSKEFNILKEDTLNNMKKRYLELKKEGLNENEAIGIVISELSNINDKLKNLNSTKLENNTISSQFTSISKSEIKEFLSIKKKVALWVAIGVFLCILAGASVILFGTLVEDKILFSGASSNLAEIIPILPLFILIAPAVALFIYSGFKSEKYKYIENGEFDISIESKLSLTNSLNEFKPKFTLAIIIGVSLCILSPIPILIGEIVSNDITPYFVVLTIKLIAIAVFLFVYFGTYKTALNALLKTEDFAPKKLEENKFTSVIASIVFPLATCVFLINSFIFGNWDTSWIIFPVTGILFGVFCTIYSFVKNKSS